MEKGRRALIVVLVFFFLALGIRIALMDLRPLHHDEGVNGYFVSNIVEGKGWKYDAENYHGPTLFYITALSFLAFGQNIFALRIVPVLFGSLVVLLPFLFWKKLGYWGLATSCFALAFSPALLYFSMFAIHEILFAFFAISSLVLLLKFIEEKKGWMLYSGAACLAFLFATKEASFFIGPFILLLCLAYALFKKENFMVVLRKNRLRLIVAILLFLAIYCALFTSFFTNLKGLEDSVKTISLWGPRVVEEKGHDKPFSYYFQLLCFSEIPLLVCGILGIALAFLKRNKLFSAFGIFFLVFLFGTSFVPYKTPWIVVNFLPVLALLFGFFFSTVFTKKSWHGECSSLQCKDKALVIARENALAFKPGFLTLLKKKLGKNGSIVGFIVMGIALASILYSTYYVNILFPAADKENVLSYVQTPMEAKAVFESIQKTGGKICISIEDSSTWPMPWLFRDKQIEYHGKEALERSEFLQGFGAIIVDRSKERTVESNISGYDRIAFELRPGTLLTAFFREN